MNVLTLFIDNYLTDVGAGTALTLPEVVGGFFSSAELNRQGKVESRS